MWFNSKQREEPYQSLTWVVWLLETISFSSAGHSMETARDKREEGVDDVKSSWPLRVGLHTCYNGGDSGLIPKSHLSSDWGLQLDPMKSESLVIA